MRVKTEITSITALRGIAAMMVVLFHFTKGYFDEDSIIRNVFRFGWTGVEVFFVISGFVIVWSMINNAYHFINFKTFILKRLVRIEPPYIISAIFIVFLSWLSALAPGFQGKFVGFDLSLILMHLGYLVRFFGETWLNPVYWSLEIEFHFYFLIALLFPLIIHSNKIINLSVLIILLLCSNFRTEWSPL